MTKRQKTPTIAVRNASTHSLRERKLQTALNNIDRMLLKLEIVFSLLIATARTFNCTHAFDSRLPHQTSIQVGVKAGRTGSAMFNIGSPGGSDGEIFADSLTDDQMVMESSTAMITGEASTAANEQTAMDSAETIIVEAGSELQDSASSEAPFFATVATAKAMQKKQRFPERENIDLSRRAWLQTGAFVFAGTVLGAASILHDNAVNTAPKLKVKAAPLATSNSTRNTARRSEASKLGPVNITQVAAETNVNVSLNCAEACVSVDSTSFTKIKRRKVPRWLPSWLTPQPQVVKEISNSELLIAAIIAGSTIDLMRTSILYPIQTVKTRIQTDIHNFTISPPTIQSRLINLETNVKRHVDEGNLYAGIKPSLLVSVPATGVYYGVRDVTKRMLVMTPLNGVEIALFAALVADVVSLCFRTPADALTLRLQNLDVDVGDWFGDSVKRLPSIIITDVPYLLSKISLSRLLIHGNISINQYTGLSILTGKCMRK